MIRYGASGPGMGSMTKDALFISRLQLLMIMASAIEKNYPLDNRRRKAVIENADAVFHETLERSMALCEKETGDGPAGSTVAPAPDQNESYMNFLWLQRVQLLAVITKSMAQGNPMGQFRWRAFAENMRWISGQLDEPPDLLQIPFLNVA